MKTLPSVSIHKVRKTIERIASVLSGYANHIAWDNRDHYNWEERKAYAAGFQEGIRQLEKTLLAEKLSKEE